MSESKATPTPDPRRHREQFVPEAGKVYSAVVIKPREPGKFAVSRIEVSPGKFSGLVVFVNSPDRELIPGEFLKVRVNTIARNGRFCFSDLVN